ncbi:unnamed protein product [Ranitomeya imitator]|uniref:ADAMTS/ADAMTS-like Spacer 1 domain-containing protein n=1 Tax=Ranitomeya imitator TaxID=111125 RepID=A0ABN9LN97_9NEOB|nr:unnamed protein product [Ranitomeya imitator]
MTESTKWNKIPHILDECQPPIGSSIHPRSVSPNEWLGEKDFTRHSVTWRAIFHHGVHVEIKAQRLHLSNLYADEYEPLVQGTEISYIEAAIIPAGARRIRVVEDKPAHSFLALKDSIKKSINSDWKIELPGEFQIAGTTIRYVRRGLWEKMSAKGPTKTPLHLMVLLFHDQNYGIHYEYTIPVNQSAEQTTEVERQPDPLYMWTHSSWEGCSVQCGGAHIVRSSKTMIGSNAIYTGSPNATWHLLIIPANFTLKSQMVPLHFQALPCTEKDVFLHILGILALKEKLHNKL